MTTIGSSSSPDFSSLQQLVSKLPVTAPTNPATERYKKIHENLAAAAATPVQMKSLASVRGQVATPQTQIAAQSLSTTAPDTTMSTAAKSVQDQFLDFASQSTEDKYADMIFKSMGLTKDDLAKMSPEERTKVVEKIREKVKEMVEKETGIDTGNTAAATPALATALTN